MVASRRRFLQAGIAGGATLATAAIARAEGDPLITEIQDWARYTGEGVDATPYGMPIKYEADVVRRNVEWLTADTISSINFTPIHALDGTITPQGCAFERHHSGAIELRKEDYRLMINGLVDTPLVFTYEISNASRAKTMSISANARRTPAWNGPARSSTARSSPMA
jgi:sulfane dehydrogenase subunit SoxC